MKRNETEQRAWEKRNIERLVNVIGHPIWFVVIVAAFIIAKYLESTQ